MKKRILITLASVAVLTAGLLTASATANKSRAVSGSAPTLKNYMLGNSSPAPVASTTPAASPSVEPESSTAPASVHPNASTPAIDGTSGSSVPSDEATPAATPEPTPVPPTITRIDYKCVLKDDGKHQIKTYQYSDGTSNVVDAGTGGSCSNIVIQP